MKTFLVSKEIFEKSEFIKGGSDKTLPVESYIIGIISIF